MEAIGLCISCAHFRRLALWKRVQGEPEGLCFDCRDAAEESISHGPCVGCWCHAHRMGDFEKDERTEDRLAAKPEKPRHVAPGSPISPKAGG